MSLSLLRNIISTYANRNCATLLCLGFVAGLPYVLLSSTLSIWLREAQIGHKAIGLISLIGVVYSFKWIWTPVLDQVPLPILHHLGRRKSYLILSQCLIFLGLVALAMCNPSGQISLTMICFILLTSFSSATQDSVIDAYRLEIAPSNQQASLSASYLFGYRIALLLAGAGALLIAQFFGTSINNYSYIAWRNTYLIFASCFIPFIIISFILKEPNTNIDRISNDYGLFRQLGSIVNLSILIGAFYGFITCLFAIKTVHNLWYIVLYLGLMVVCLSKYGILLLQPILIPIKDFASRYKSKAILLLLLIATYRLSDTVLGVMANVFYIDLGFSKEQIASVIKVFGMFMTLSGALLGGILVAQFNILNVMLLGAILCPATNLLFWYLANVDANMQLLIITISCDNLSSGIATTAFIAYLSNLTNIKFSATQYALLSSIMLLLPRLVGGYSGVMVEQFGYGNFFLITTIMGIPAILLVIHQISNNK